MAKSRDPQSPVTSVKIGEFLGLVENADEFDLPPGAAVEQVNVTLVTPGALTTRDGTRKVNFED